MSNVDRPAPSIPEVSLNDEGTARVLVPMKDCIEMLMRRQSGQTKLADVPATATLADVITALNTLKSQVQI